MPKQIKRHHHYVPRLYLKGFADPTNPSFIWVYERGRPYHPGQKPGKHHPYKRSLRLTGAADDFYAYQTQSGNTDFDTYENLLEQLEKPVNEILTKLRAQQSIAATEKQQFAAYIALMIKRVPRYRERSSALWQPLLDEFEAAAHILQQLDQHERQTAPDDQQRRARIQQLRTQYHKIMTEYRAGMPAEIVLNTIVQLGRLPAVIAQMRWQFLIAPAGFDFVTSDNPVFYFEQLGLVASEAELTFPISSTIALATTWNSAEPEGFFPATPLAMLEINQRTISGATHQVYYGRSSDWFLGILNRRTHRFNSLYATSTATPSR